MSSRIGYPPRLIFETLEAWNTPVPERSDWCALKNCRNYKSETGGNDPDVHYMAGDAERVVGDGKDSIIQACDRDLVEHKDDLIHDVGAIEPLARNHTGIGIESFPVSTITVHDSWRSR